MLIVTKVWKTYVPSKYTNKIIIIFDFTYVSVVPSYKSTKFISAITVIQ